MISAKFLTTLYHSQIKSRQAVVGADGITSFANISGIWGAGAKWGSFMVWYGSNFSSDAW